MKLKAKKTAPLLEILGYLFPDSSKTTLRGWIKQGRIVIGGKRMRNAMVSVAENTLFSFEDKVKHAEFGIKILYEDKDLVVLQKPAGLLSVATKFEITETVHSTLKEHSTSRRVFPVHRLDRETSGVMVFAYTNEAKEGLKAQFQLHTIERRYLALVKGNMESSSGKWESFLKEDANYFVSSHPDGKRAITHYEVVKVTGPFTALKLSLETGRKNQIRVHASEAGFPIVGDQKYGASENPLKRLGLHAYHLSFIHPITKKKMEFSSLPPPSFKNYFGKIS